MTDRLGDILLKKGKITKAQLDQVVQCQILFAGRQATVFLELGYVGEKDLAEALSQRYGVEAVSIDELKDIPEEVVKLVPKNLAIRFELIPFRRLAKRIYLAMINPKDKTAITEIEKLTGLKVIPCVALEVYLRWALERYYGVKREARFIQLERSLDLMRELYPYTALTSAEPGQSLWRGSKTIPGISSTISPEFSPLIDPQSITAIEGAPKDIEDFWERVGRTSHPRALLPKVKKELRKARAREEVLSLILRFGERIFPRVALFYIRNQVAFGWKGTGEGIEDKKLASLMIPLELESVISQVYNTSSYFLGPLPSTPVNQRILLGLGGIVPNRVLVMPILIFGKPVIIFYADSGREPGKKQPDLASLQELLGEAQLAFLRILKESKKQASGEK